MMLLRSPEEDDRSERFEAERRAERARQHAPAIPPPQVSSPRVTSAMTALAFTVLNGDFSDRRDAARVLAELILEQS